LCFAAGFFLLRLSLFWGFISPTHLSLVGLCLLWEDFVELVWVNAGMELGWGWEGVGNVSSRVGFCFWAFGTAGGRAGGFLWVARREGSVISVYSTGVACLGGAPRKQISFCMTATGKEYSLDIFWCGGV
jgi:hypothetical protein